MKETTPPVSDSRGCRENFSDLQVGRTVPRREEQVLNVVKDLELPWVGSFTLPAGDSALIAMSTSRRIAYLGFLVECAPRRRV